MFFPWKRGQKSTNGQYKLNKRWTSEPTRKYGRTENNDAQKSKNTPLGVLAILINRHHSWM